MSSKNALAQEFPRAGILPVVTFDGGSEDEHFGGETESLELSLEIREELLDQRAWNKLLGNYAQTVRLAVALTDCNGRVLGPCHNPQPVWRMADAARRASTGDQSVAFSEAHEAHCPFCLESSALCRAVSTALSTGHLEMAHDLSGLVHLAVPLTIGRHHLGALIAGQVFNHYPEPLRLQRLARRLDISSGELWQCARLHPPIRGGTLQVYGELLRALGKAFLRERYAAILHRRLARANLRLRLLVDEVKGHALFTVNGDGAVTSWNGGAERMFGYMESEVVGHDYSRFFTPEDIQAGAPAALLQQPRHGESVNDERWQVRKDGSRFFAEGSITALGSGESLEFGRLAIDVTDRRNAEEALRHTQKLESIGVLASGIAHDFNNLLTSILSGVSFAKANLPLEHPGYPWLTIAEEASEKAADLAYQLLAYGGKGKFLITQFDLSGMIRDMLKLLQTSIPKTVELQLSLGTNLPAIEADASQIQQIVMNLVINGAESIGPEGGTLRVLTGIADAGKTSSGGKNQVFMEVQDSGSGMSEETKARIFDPFFTTKFAGRGLGLAAVSGIVRGHQGTMEVESEIGKGSTFRIYFPAVEEAAERRKTLPAPRARLEKATGTVLVVDDEPGLRKIARAILEHSGYKVLTAEDGREAVAVFREHADSITAILLDMTMPVMNGAQAFLLIRAIRPDVPIVVSTGYSEVATRELFGVGKTVGFVQKPYTAARLCERIRTTSEVGKEAAAVIGRALPMVSLSAPESA